VPGEQRQHAQFQHALLQLYLDGFRHDRLLACRLPIAR
jgi:hypothetical protein